MKSSHRFGAVALASLLLPGLAAASEAPGKSSGAKVVDLTNLSLDELYNLDVVKLNALGSHTHLKGEIMFGYHFMYMQMADYRVGTRHLTTDQLFNTTAYKVAHARMEMSMHMFEAMYAFTPDLTVMAMLPYKDMSMEHVTSAGTRFTQFTSGIGDLDLLASYGLWTSRSDTHRLLLNAGVGLPTGSVDVQDYERGDPTRTPVQLEYPMQLGTGTFDLKPGVTYLGHHGQWAWGAQGVAELRLGRNDADYAFGDAFRATTWVAYGVLDWLAPYVRFEGRDWGRIRGHDSRLNPAANPESDPLNQGGDRIDAFLGVNLYAPRGPLKGLRFIVEGGLPVYERLNGPQLSTDYFITAGVSYTF